MTVLTVKGQSNATVILRGLLQQHGMPALTPEGIDALSAKFGRGLMIGNGVISFDGKPLIDALRAIYADADSRRFFVSAKDGQHQQDGTVTERYRAEIAAARKQTRMPDDWQDVRGRYAADSVTAKHMDEVEASRGAGR
ncbi:hypothetical protein ABID65_001118 [Bradyrhizobium sp. S3.9.2]|uniref:hypothetical protein n=1 Tax=Bradyrhizobium sp. S3.9.2 TaxID=3156432 RepID=UPI0033989342